MADQGESPDADGTTTKHRVSELIESNLKALIAALLGFLAVAVAAILVSVATPFKVAAAALAIVGLVALLVWIADPWYRWREDAKRRFSIIGLPLLAAGTVIIVGLAFQPTVVFLNNPAHLIVLDTSTAMGKEFDEGLSKLEASQVNLQQHVSDFGTGSQQGLATYGSDDCQSAEPLRELVGIAPNQADAIEQAAGNVQVGGSANLVSAGIQALNKLQGFTSQRRVTLIAGSLHDECGRDLRELLDKALELKVPVTWDLVGLAFTEEDKVAVSGLPDTNVVLVDTNEELDAALELFLFRQVVQDGLRDMEIYIDRAREPLNEAGDAMNSGDFELAKQKVAEAGEGATAGRPRFEGIADDARTGDFSKVEAMYAEQMKRLAVAVPLMERTVEIAAASGPEPTEEQTEERNEAVTVYNKAIGDYNSQLNEITNEIDRLLNETFSVKEKSESEAS